MDASIAERQEALSQEAHNSSSEASWGLGTGNSSCKRQPSGNRFGSPFFATSIQAFLV